MSQTLVISVRLHEGWYHGNGIIPSPARLFQALVAGRGLSGPLSEDSISALQWLEYLPPPIVAAPATKVGQPVATYVPNNDLDAKQGDHRRIGEIRTKKPIQPLLFDSDVPFLFCWRLDEQIENESEVRKMCELARGIYQLGRTVDAAWAWGEVLSDDELAERLRSHRGPVKHPSAGRGNIECPTPGSLASLIARHADLSRRYAMTADGKGQTFRRRSKPKWRLVSYEGAATRICFDLIDRETTTFMPWPTTHTLTLVTTVRDTAVSRLVKALPDHETEVKQTLVGRKANGKNAGPTSARVRIVPLPSIGHEHADQQIRRLLIEIPSGCPLRADDVIWAFSGQTLSVHGRAVDLVRSQAHRQLEHYGIEARASRHWQTVTPVALSSSPRRRIEPNKQKRRDEDLKGAAERRFEQELAASAIRQSLRHADVRTNVSSVRVQREPFSGRGHRTDDFAAEPRFNKHVLWHVELEFAVPIKGPLVIGDGRFCGFGLMTPARAVPSVFGFAIESGLNPNPDPIRLSRALRRAVMARARDVLETYRLPPFFTGHRQDGAPARSEEEPHLVFVFDPVESQLLIITPEHIDRRIRWSNENNLATLESALRHFHEIRAGRDGQLRIRPICIDKDNNRLFANSNVWESVTSYRVNRHARRSTAQETLKDDLLAECERRGLPRPEITLLEWNAQRETGLQGKFRLTFKHAVRGPIILGRTRHIGGGIFAGPNGQ